MKMPEKIALWLQFNIYLITLDGYPPISFISGDNKTIMEPDVRWQLAVDTIDRCLVAGLMDVWNEGWMRENGLENYLALVNALAQHNPFNFQIPSDSAIYWIEPLLCSTDLCKYLVSKYELQKFEGNTICYPFMKEIEKIFEENGVGWKNSPLVDIRKE
ncbi:hypothetical protein [Herbaspirillum seropedicae]|uniref:hypothetical protein n=1 Tax=Herbaspirillum seropedicae TaxID=964 RepID=UPI000847F4BE|nr:hypothetical protein [Herbaspirillum seropedicae]AON55503.1 hypothetical protein Hsc_3235 [Herbaspirillum seropedicae]